jgi:hypothetical protein
MQWRDSMRASGRADLWQAESATGVVDVATGSMFAIELGQLVVKLVKSHLGKYQQAQLLQTHVEIIMLAVKQLEQRVQQAAPSSDELHSIIKAINFVLLALKVRGQCRSAVAGRAGHRICLL